MSKYQFSLNPKVKNFVEWQLEHFIEDKQQLEKYKNDLIPSNTQGFSPTGGTQGGVQGRPTENTAIKIATNPYILNLERNIGAIEAALKMCDDADIKLIDLVYWRRTHTIEGASIKLNYSARTGYRHINNILCRIALEMGLINV